MTNPAGDGKTVQDRRRELLRRRIAERGLSTAAAGPPTLRAGERYRLSAGQHRMWFRQAMDAADTALNIGVAYRLTGALDRQRLQRSLHDVVDRHSVLRTTYSVGDDGEPYQQFVDHVSVPWQDHDLSGLAETDREQRITALTRTEFGRPFRLDTDPPLRVTLIRVGHDHFVLVLVVHHICWDDDCWAVFFDELAAAYRGHPLSGQPPQYAAVEPAAGPAEADVAYWRNTLRPLPEPLELPGPPTAQPASPADRRTRALPADLYRRVEDFARERSATPFMVLLAGFGALTQRYTGAADLLVAVPVTERSAAAQHAIGYFGNTLLLRIAAAPDQTFTALVDTVRATCLAGFTHQSVGVDRVVSEVNPQRTPGRDGLDHLVRLGFSLRKSVAGLTLDGVTVHQLDLGAVSAQLPLALTIVSGPDGMSAEFEYQTAVLAEHLVERLSAHYLQLLDGALRDPHRPLAGVAMFSGRERAALLAQSHGELVATAPGTLVALLESAAAAAPEATAVVTEQTRLSYTELHRRANRLARWLIGHRIGPDDVVGLRIGASVEFVVAAFAVLKAGAAYLPIDPAQPADRIDYLIADSHPGMVIGPAEFAAAERAAAVLPEATVTDAERVRPLRPQHLAYVIYTSGSTGRPKGVAVAHAAIAEHLAGFSAQWDMTADDRMLQSSSVGFDASVAEIFLTLSIGAQLVVPGPGALGDLGHLTELIERHRITVLHMVPSLLDTLLQLSPARQWRGLRHLPVGGEALPGRVADKFTDAFDAQLRNHYGPTEAVVCSTHQPVDRRYRTGVVPIGVPNRNVHAYLLDRALQPVPAGVVGELYLGGAQLARGYLGRAALTAERFVADPFNPGMRLYRSGDLARRNPIGELEFVGRADEQVKVRGYRIELGEVEAAIATHPAVRQCVVVADGSTLAAYLVADGPLDVDRVRAHAATLLPDYMLPSAFAVLPELPRLVSGKPDKAALPAPIPVAAHTFRAPATATEQRICSIFAGLFDRGRIGADDSFFLLGGHSLLAARLVAQLRTEFGVELTVRAVFDAPTPAGLAARLVEQFCSEFDLDLDALDTADVAPSGGRPELTASIRPDRIPLSYSQLAGWFQYRIEGARDAFNLPVALRISGPLDIAALAAALNAVVTRHDALRTNFGEHAGMPYQFVHPTRQLDLSIRAVAADRVDETIAELRTRVLTPEAGPLIDATLLRVADDSHLLLVIVHHLVGDHVSLGIIVDDLIAGYRAGLTGQPRLPASPIQFADYAMWQRAAFDEPGEWAGAELAHWRDALAGLPDEICVVADRPRRPLLGKRAETARFTLPAARRAELVRLGEHCAATEFMVCQAAVAATLHRLGGGTDIAVGAPVAARIDPAAERVVGLFANVVALRNDLSGDPSLRTLVLRSRDTVLDGFAHQETPIERVVEAVGPARNQFRNPLYQHMLHFRGEDWAPAPRPLTADAASTVVALPMEFDVALLDLDFEMTVAADGGLAARVVGNADRYEPDTVRLIADMLKATLAAFATTPDRRLSGWEPVAAAAPSAPVAPQPITAGEPETERHLIALLEELLEITGVGGDDNFFALGGDSIIAIKWSAAAADRGLTLTPAMIFEHLTIAELAAAAAVAGPEPAAAADDSAPDREYPPMSTSGLSVDALAELTAAWQQQS